MLFRSLKPVLITFIFFLFGTLSSFAGGQVDQQTISNTIQILEQKYGDQQRQRIEKGVKQAINEGVMTGNPLVDIRVTLYDGSFHSVDSSDIAFHIAGAMALRKAALEANPILLEPIVEVEVSVPEDYTGQISGDLSSRRGKILGMEPRGQFEAVKASVPLAEMFKYATELRSMTHGKGSYSMKFSTYELVPHKVAERIIERLKKEKQQEGK